MSAILKRQGIQIRKRGLSEEEIAQAMQLYEQGWSLTRIGQHFGVDSRTVRSRLLERGVKPRYSTVHSEQAHDNTKDTHAALTLGPALQFVQGVGEKAHHTARTNHDAQP
ncbi:helix-turn-helix domain-containing protein [Nocardiopsis sp. NPDC055551]